MKGTAKLNPSEWETGIDNTMIWLPHGRHAACLSRLPSGEWAPNLPPTLVRWESFDIDEPNGEGSNRTPDDGDFPEIPWFPYAISTHEQHRIISYRRCVPVSREDAGWPALESDDG